MSMVSKLVSAILNEIALNAIQFPHDTSVLLGDDVTASPWRRFFLHATYEPLHSADAREKLFGGPYNIDEE
ncbi:unnamed protein product, partial [Amoebophrya sp. A25]|eukprot:GSA25T00011072001.1